MTVFGEYMFHTRCGEVPLFFVCVGLSYFVFGTDRRNLMSSADTFLVALILNEPMPSVCANLKHEGRESGTRRQYRHSDTNTCATQGGRHSECDARCQDQVRCKLLRSITLEVQRFLKKRFGSITEYLTVAVSLIVKEYHQGEMFSSHRYQVHSC